MNSTIKSRNYSLDVLRVFAMFIIIASHMIGNGVFELIIGEIPNFSN